MLLEGKKLLVTGVLTRESIAYAAAQALQEQGAEIVLTSFGRAMGLTEKSARRLPDPVDVLEMDANDPAHIESVSAEIGSRWGRLDGFLHAIAFAPQDALGGNFLHTPWESVATAIQTSAYSLKAIATGMLPQMREHGARSSRSTSTRGSRGRSTTGWAWPRRRSNRSPGTSRATSDRTGSA